MTDVDPQMGEMLPEEDEKFNTFEGIPKPMELGHFLAEQYKNPNCTYLQKIMAANGLTAFWNGAEVHEILEILNSLTIIPVGTTPPPVDPTSML